MANGNGNGKTDQYDIREESRQRKRVIKLDPRKMKTAMELTGMAPEMMDKALRQAGEVYDATFEYETFDEAEQRELDDLSNQIAMNRFAKVPQPVQGLLPGNEYAVNLGNLSSGVQNLVASLVNTERAKKLYGDPQKVERLTNAAQQKINKAERLRTIASEMEAAGRGTSADNFRPVNEIIKDAERLEAAAEKDLQAAESARGSVQKAQRLEEKKAQAQADQEEREEFVQEFGGETYQQAIEAEAEQREQDAITARERIRQNAITTRMREREKYATHRARIEGQAEIEKERVKADGKKKKGGIPNHAKPNYIQKFVSTYIKPLEDSYDELVDATETGDVDISTPAQLQQKENLEQKIRMAQDIELESQFWEEAEFEELPPSHYPTREEMQQLERMENLGLPPELIDAWKFYNRISLTKAPGYSNPDQQRGSGAGDMSEIYEPQGTGTVLRRE